MTKKSRCWIQRLTKTVRRIESYDKAKGKPFKQNKTKIMGELLAIFAAMLLATKTRASSAKLQSSTRDGHALKVGRLKDRQHQS